MTSKETRLRMSMHRISRPAFSAAQRGSQIALATAVALVALAALAVPAFGLTIENYTLTSSTQAAGGHPNIRASFELPDAGQSETAKNIEVNLPTGVFGNPGAIDRCTAAAFAINECSPASQAGVITVWARYNGTSEYLLGSAPLYNMQREGEEESARLEFVAPIVNVPIVIPLSVRSGSDYGVRMTVKGIPQNVPVQKSSIEVWGFPAASEHDPERFPVGGPNDPPGCPGLSSATCTPPPFPTAGGALVHPYINNPTVCTGQSLPASLRVTTYENPNGADEAHANFAPTTNCETERFDPILNIGLTTKQTDAPSGLDIQLKADQFLEKPPSPSELRSARITLPEGLSINPDAADGQTSCSDAQANFAGEGPGHCPDNSKIGTFDVETPAIEGPLEGSLYIGEPQPGHQYRVFMLADGFGVHVKLVANVDPDPATGRVTMSVTDLPQVPFAEFNLHLFASDRGLMATPMRCTLYEVDSIFTPWNAALAPQHSRPLLSLTEGSNGSSCPGAKRPFNPRLVAGTSNPVAGQHSDFHLRLDRDDGDQFLGQLNFTMPPGLTASLRGLSYCPEAGITAAASNFGKLERAQPSCPDSSLIGTTNVAAGPGAHPFHAVGRMYLAGPFKGAPLSLVAVTPALAGPYDYGVVVVRVAINVDPLDAHVIADSETVPNIIGGIPIRLRSIQVNIEKPDFMINPTYCGPQSVDSQGIGDQGTVADFSSYFQSVNCAGLAFKPKMTIKQIGGRKQTKRGRDPSVQFDLWTRRGDANVKSVAVTLPKAWAIDQRHLGNICSKAELAAKHCAGRQPIGQVRVDTPLLDRPLQGPAYAVSGFGKLPHLAFILAGQVTIIPEAESSSVNGGHLKTVVPIVPDAPIGHFRLTLLGKKQGYLVNTRSLCGAASFTTVEYRSQNGKKRIQKVRTQAACGAAKR
jgi:hypothetical protein